MKTRQFIILCLLIIIGFGIIIVQNIQERERSKEMVDLMMRQSNHEHQVMVRQITEKLGI